MKKSFMFAALIAPVVFAASALAGIGSDIADNGIHYNLNIIGVQKGKKVDMTNTDRHTIFVPLNTQGLVENSVKISYVPGPDFQVLDGNATDANGALIQVPYQYCSDLNTGCQDMLSYNVYAVALGKPGGTAVVEAHCTYDTNVVDTAGTAGLTCEDTLLMKSFQITRTSGKPKPVNISDVFLASGCLDLNASGMCDTGDVAFSNLWIFNIPQLDEYFWSYNNTGLKLMQLRFYPSTSGSIGIVK